MRRGRPGSALRRMLRKWLRAGVMGDGTVRETLAGTPQGGVISPLLANIFLHTVLDEWFVKEVQPRMRGQCYIVRFADDFVIGFEREEDARRVMAVLPKQFAKYGLSIHPEKTALIRFQKPPRWKNKAEGQGTFTFLGLTHFWAKSRRDYWVIKRRTARKRLRRTVRSLWRWCRDNRHMPIREQHRILCSKLRGHYQYYGIRCNLRPMAQVFEHARRAWRFWLNRRSRKGNKSWDRFEQRLKHLTLPKPRIVHAI